MARPGDTDDSLEDSDRGPVDSRSGLDELHERCRLAAASTSDSLFIPEEEWKAQVEAAADRIWERVKNSEKLSPDLEKLLGITAPPGEAAPLK